MKEKTPNKHEKCAECGETTEYATMDRTNALYFYIEDKGFLCQLCFDHEYNYEIENAK
jgi:recombinational DNA repair protein (RecF pathway)|tara:strand:+ start:430 stop:603 length:174 start_codon:yes stop_codon:yes gene_type:complete